MQVPVSPDEALTWTSVLNIANTFLVAMVGFLLREAWKTVHRRMDMLEEQYGDMRERVASLEASKGWSHPHRRHTDSGPHSREE